MSDFKKGDTVVLKFPCLDGDNIMLLVEHVSWDGIVSVVWFNRNWEIQRDRFHADLLEQYGEK